MKIEWNKVTWYSKLLAIIVFVATFALAFKLGMAYEDAQAWVSWDVNDGSGMMQGLGDETGAGSGAPVVGVGEHCGGFIKDAPVCAAGLHCALTVGRPDTGGTCVAD